MVRESAARLTAMNDPRQIGLALHRFNETYDRLPPAVLYDKQGKPLHSWRVLVLPFLGEEALYDEFRLEEPWDSPHNSALIARMPKFYKPRKEKAESMPGLTFCQVFEGPGAAFDSDPRAGLRPYTVGGIKAAVFEGGHVTKLPASFSQLESAFVLLAEAGEAVPWTQPTDIRYEPGQPLPPVGGNFDWSPTFWRSQRQPGTTVVFADARVEFLGRHTDEETIRQRSLRPAEPEHGK
jgi:Protein of unknown function (DUF1559)